MTKKPQRTPPGRAFRPVVKPIMVITRTPFQPPAKVPCVECPLARTSKPGALGGYTAQQYIEVMHGPADLACHLSKGFPDDRSTQRSCTGLAMYRANIKHKPPGGAGRAAAEVGENRELVFANAVEFMQHHGEKD